MTTRARTAVRAAMIGAFALSLAACQSEEVELEADAEDMSGGELITTPVDAEGVDVELPETEMTNVPAEEMDGAMAEDGAAEGDTAE